MKKIILSSALLLTAATASAQFSWCPEIDTDNYQRCQASFIIENLTQMNPDLYQTKGFNLGYLAGLSISSDLPLFVETGVNLNWSHCIKDYYAMVGNVKSPAVDFKFTHMTIAAPLNVAYKFGINDRVSIVPFAGFNFKLNLIAMQHIDGKKANLLKKDDMGGRDKRGNLFQLGGHTGIGVNLNKIYLGWEFEHDFVRFLEQSNGDKSRYLTNYFTAGYNF